jgi:hypothetical protein
MRAITKPVLKSIKNSDGRNFQGMNDSSINYPNTFEATLNHSKQDTETTKIMESSAQQLSFKDIHISPTKKNLATFSSFAGL